MNNGTEHTNFEGRAVYERMIEVFFYSKPNKDLKKTVHPEFMGYGTAAHEFFRNRVDVTEMAKLQSEQLRNQKVEIQRKPILEKVFAKGTSCLIMEEFDMYFKDTKHHLVARLSTILERIDGEWLVTHFHGSTPDSNIAEDEAFPLEGLRKKNEELEAKIKERTRELEIEAALERVRARTMSMQKSAELKEVVKVIFDQLSHLSINAEHAGIVVDYEPKKDFHFWVADNLEIPAKITVPYLDLVWDRQFTEAKKKGQDFFTTQLDFEEKNSFYKKLLPHIEGLTKQAQDFYLSCPGLAASTVIEKDIGLYIENFSGIPYTEKENDTLYLFAKVFQQAYTRFLDLQKAEAQAREAEIETALEKVRSRTMAMHKSEELAETALVLYEQFKALGNIPDRMSIGIFKEETKEIELWATDQFGSQLNKRFRGFWKQSAVWTSFYKAWKSGDDSFVVDLSGQKLKTWLKFIREEIKLFVDDSNIKGRRVQQAAFFSHGMLLFTTNEPVTEEIMQLLVRFAKVFSQTYTRFLDLQKAEAQAREAEIETALERVRASTMAMHRTDELGEVIKLFFQQFELLNLTIDTCLLDIVQEGSKGFNTWIATGTETYPKQVHVPFLKHPIFTDLVKARANKKDFLATNIDTKFKDAFFDHFYTKATNIKVPKKRKDLIAKGAGINASWTILPHANIGLWNYRGITYTEEENQFLIRMGKVFEQTYTRFLDLQKAEAQTREAQIEGALERVRSKTMAMHNSKDLEEIVISLFDEVLKLGIDKSIRCGIGILEGHEGMETRSVNSKPDGTVELRVGMLNMTIHPMLVGLKKAWKKGSKGYSYDYTEKDVRKYYGALNKEPEYPFNANLETLPKQEFHRSFFYSSGIIFAFSENPISEEASTILARFAAVFGQTYRRFLDLQKAESQAMEAKIETALERVRAHTMAMHNSEDVAVAVKTMFDQLTLLGLSPAVRCGIGTFDDSDYMELWTASKDPTGKVQLDIGKLDMRLHPLLMGFKKAYEDKQTFYEHKKLSGKEVREYFEIINNSPGYTFQTDLEKLPAEIYHYDFIFAQGAVFVFSPNPLSPDLNDIFTRFTKVFQQTYTRFLDLLKAEAQAREAEIELSLERIRSQAMAMNQSSDLLDIVVTMRSEFIKLGHEAHYFWHMRWQPDGYEKAMTSGDGTRIGMVMELPRDFHSHYNGMSEWENNDEPIMILALETEIAVDYLGKMITQGNFQQVDPNAPTLDDIRHIGGITFIMARTTHGEIGYSLPGVVNNPPPEDLNILERFAGVFDLAHRRFEDLQKAEAREKEAIKQSSLDRVRAEIASMRTTDDLDSITPLVWRELTTLGVPFFRCGIFIIREEEEMVHAYLSTPSGDRLAALHIGFDEEEIGLIQPAIVNWRKQEIYSEEWDQERFVKNMGTFMKQGIIKSPKKYQDGETPPEKLVLQLVPFKQGMLYAGNSEQLIPEHIELMKELAKAFSAAYSRYEDFNELEQAKSKVEVALTDLKSTQNQLVQSEKMASLGELTAGIAHEIQNPLNFVNNFSEVSVELIEEMLEEIQKGDVEEVKALADDIIQNLEKINHHGKRADGIVKGMLQHSRASSGEKEPTDINVLADEYLRLAYHGLRAKDKTFNATLETNFDDSIGKINVMTQDMGRVILNLITNAFYAVKEKKEQSPKGYAPTVTVTTRKEGNNVLILVKDNGNGISDAIKEKIFQPFFTTKPTGQGTGLGLSMSYDIVTKGHGGELKVTSKEGVGTTFTIVLPIVKNTKSKKK